MKIRELLNVLKDMLERSKNDQDYARSVYASSLAWIRWINKMADKEGCDRLNVFTYLHDIHRGFLFCCGLIEHHGNGYTPYDFAHRAFSVITQSTVLGVGDLLDRELPFDFREN